MHVLPVILLWHLVIADAGISSSPVIRLRGGNNPHSDKLKLRDSTAHKLSAEECIHEFHVSESQGLNDQEAAFRLQIAGPNALSDPPKKSTLSLVFEQFEDRLVQILLVVASISAILARFEDESLAFVEPLAIVSILFINAIVGAYQTSSAENALSALKKLQPQKACVLRNGIWNSEFPVAQIVPGDIVYVKVGEKVPADCRILSLRTTTFSTDEGSLTGESVTVSKSPAIVSTNDTAIFNKSNMLFSGTMVANGGCIAMVVNTGLRTEMGLIDASVQAAKGEEHKTPLAEKLDIFGNQLTVIIATICVSVWIVSIPKFSNPVFSSWTKGAVFYAKIAVALAVAAIPEGLPAVITLCLSLGTHRMAKKNVIVRKLKSVETLGCTSVICTDKTGTLTTNQMTVKSFVTFSGSYVATAPVPVDVEVTPEANAEVSSTVDPEVVEDDWPWEQEQEQEQDKVLEEEEEVDAEDRILSPAIESAAQTASDTSTVSTTERTVEGISFEPVGDVEGFRPGTMTSTALQDLASVCAICNEAAIEFIDGRFTRLGEPTEAALKVFVEKLGTANFPKSTDPVQMAKQCNEYWSGKYSRLATLEFSRDRKCMSVLCRSKDRRINRLMVKGAAEMMLSKCNRLKLEDGSVVPITIELRSRLEEKISEMARRPLRCLAMAFKEGADLGPLDTFVDEVEASHSPLLTDTTNFKELETELILVGICGIKDPARGEVADAMLRCKTAGIRVIMITGDSKETAVSIAKEVHILDPKDDNQLNAFTGAEFFSLSEVEQLNLLRYGNKVFCRAEPVHKQKLISMLSALGEITAMTGDGVNDSPALQQADIGIAMGITGSEVAKEAADMILADDNFATIVSAVEEGRCIYSNMQSFISFLISANIGEIFTVFFATLLGLPEPLSPLLLLWLNLVTDGPPATALGFNPADPNIMKLPPRPRDEPILSKWLLVRYLITGIYVSFATIGVFVWWYLDKGVTLWQLSRWGSCSTWPDFSNSYLFCDEAKPCEIFTAHKGVAQTLSLSALVVMEMLKALSAVSLDASMLRIPPWKNKWLIPAVALPSLMHLLTLYSPVIASAFGLAPLSMKEWKMVMLFALPILVVEEGLKYIGRRQQKFRKLAHQLKLENLKAFAKEIGHKVHMHRPGPIPSPMF